MTSAILPVHRARAHPRASAERGILPALGGLARRTAALTVAGARSAATARAALTALGGRGNHARCVADGVEFIIIIITIVAVTLVMEIMPGLGDLTVKGDTTNLVDMLAGMRGRDAKPPLVVEIVP